MQLKEPVDIIIPTMDNLDQLFACMNSISMMQSLYPVRFIVVNNGEAKLELMFPEHIKVITTYVKTDSNMGWEGGLMEGLKHSSSKYVMFANDDIYIPRSSSYWLQNLVRKMDVYDTIGAIGPSSNCVSGIQNIFNQLPFEDYNVRYLIGFCMLLRREALDKAGGVQYMAHGGDDFDLSIRIRKAGYYLIADRTQFVYHHGFQTGERVYGKPSDANGWNSRNMIDNTNMEIIRKHGFTEWWQTACNQSCDVSPEISGTVKEEDLIPKYIKSGVVLDLGCGASKTIPDAIGVDIVPKGEMIDQLQALSVADVTADVTVELPFEDNYADTIIARHILEHCVNAIGALKNWKRILKPGGRLIVAVPDSEVRNTIILNPEHVHAFTSESLESLASLLGFKQIANERFYNHISFTSVFENEE